MKLPHCVVLLTMFAALGANAEAECPYLPTESAPAIEFSLPTGLLKDFSVEMPPLFFEGFNPKVVRKTLPFGSPPKITIERYSSQPSITYDEVEGAVVIRSQQCVAQTRSAAVSSRRLPWMGLAVSVLFGITSENAGSVAMPATMFSLMAASLLPKASAQDDACLPSVKVVVEAPAGTMDAVEQCWAEVENPEDICPDPFPTFPTCEDAEVECQVVVVGAATGGLYAATRMVDSGLVNAEDVCIFEMQGRVGGRAFSMRGLGPDGDLSVDSGGYRTWPKYTPTLHALVTDYLGLNVACYDDSDPCGKYTIVDEKGEKNGFATFNEKMLEKLIEGGACWYPRHELVRLEKSERAVATARTENNNILQTVPFMSTKLYFANGVVATATHATVLNIPQRPLLKIVRNSKLDATEVLDLPKLQALHSVQTTVSSKLYLYYPRGSVFWKKLGLHSGDFSYPGDAQNMLLEGRYSDGHVKCDDPTDMDTCHGFLLAVYATDFSGNKAQYFRRFQKDRPQPVTFITNENLEGREFLSHAHQRLRDFHRYANTGGTYSGFEADQAFNRGGPPTFAVLGTWNTAIPWVGGAYHGWTNIDHIDLAMELFADDGIFVVTEAFSMLHGWAEGPIKVADRVLEKYLGVERPWSFPVEDIEQYTHDTSSAPKTTGSTGEGCERQLPPVSLEEIQEHDMPDDCYVAMHGVVYDLTTFATTHAGGSESIYSTCGTEGTADFAAFHGPSLLNAVSSNIVGPYGASSLAAHDSEDDCWAIIHGKIYDLTLFEHTGPMGPVHDICGQDGTAAFDSRHGGRPELLNNITHLVIVPTLPASIVQDHDSVDDCWSIIDGTIYDLTLFNHTGPMGPIRDICGKDGTADFNAKHGARPELLDSLSGFIVAQAHVVLEITVGGASSGNSGGGSGGSSSSGGGSGGGAGDEVFCFTADALVLMADGTLQSIQDVQVGDFVDTGTGQGRGRVTQTLHHPIYNHVPVTRLETAHGVLVGTPSHPVLSFAQQEEDGGVLSSWVAFQSLATDNGTVDNNNNKMEYIDVFYNLEIDGEDPYHIEGESSHSYVVNGIVASGLGDSAVLNRLYPRQQGWKDKKMRLTMDGLEEKDQ